MAATKDQERRALEKIRKIVEDLGEDSYVATAFEGCFEDAEENIENDFACSWKQRAESAQEKLEECRYKLDTVKTERASYKEQVDEWSEMYAELQMKVLSPSDMSEFLRLVDRELGEICDTIKTSEAQIINYAEEPDSEEFRSAVATHRDAISRNKAYDDLQSRIAFVINLEV